MGDPRAQDLLSLDRDVASGWKELTRWRAELARDPDACANEDPIEPVRRIAGKSMLDALTDLEPSAADIPLRGALRRWVFALTQARIGRRNEVAFAKSASEPRGAFHGKHPRLVSFRESWRGVVAAPSPAEADLWLDAAAEAAPGLSAIARASAGRRIEVARRLGAAHPWTAQVGLEPSALRDAAVRLLDATEDLSRAVWKPSSPRERAGMASVIHCAVARDAGDGWPAQLTTRWLDDAFAGARGLRLEIGPLPPARGAASFARVLYAFGFAVRSAAAATSMPFSLAHDPAFVSAHRWGFVFGALAADAEWQRRVLGVGLRAALSQVRAVGRAALLDARLHAARILLGDDAALAPADRFDEVGGRLFDGGIPRRMRGAWPSSREDEPARFVALLESRRFAENLRDRFDSDWYRNPRAWAHFRSLGAAPALEPVDGKALASQVDLIARALDEALG